MFYWFIVSIHFHTYFLRLWNIKTDSGQRWYLLTSLVLTLEWEKSAVLINSGDRKPFKKIIELCFWPNLAFKLKISYWNKLFVQDTTIRLLENVPNEPDVMTKQNVHQKGINLCFFVCLSNLKTLLYLYKYWNSLY